MYKLGDFEDLVKFEMSLTSGCLPNEDKISLENASCVRSVISAYVFGCLNVTKNLLKLWNSLYSLEPKFDEIKNLKDKMVTLRLNWENKKCLMLRDNFVSLIDTDGITYEITNKIDKGGNISLQARCFRVGKQDLEKKEELNGGKLVVYDMINNKGTDNSIETENVNNITLDNIIDKIVEAINEIIDKSEKVEISKDRLS